MWMTKRIKLYLGSTLKFMPWIAYAMSIIF